MHFRNSTTDQALRLAFFPWRRRQSYFLKCSGVLSLRWWQLCKTPATARTVHDVSQCLTIKWNPLKYGWQDLYLRECFIQKVTTPHQYIVS